MSRAGPAGQRRAVGRLEEGVQRAVAGEEGLEVGGQQGSGGMRGSADGPWRPQLDQQPLAVDGGVGVVGLVDFDELPVATQEELVRPERDLPGNEIPLAAGGEVAEGSHGHVVGTPLEHHGGFRQRRSPRPLADRPRIARGGQRPRPEVGGHEQAVAFPPRDAALGLGQREAPVDERFRLEVELPDHVGIGAAPRDRDEAAAVLGFEHRRPVPDPVLLFGPREGVDVDHRLPGGFGPAILVERGPPPEALRVRGVAPQVVVVVPDLRDGRDPLLRVEDGEDPPLERGEGRAAGKGPRALRIAFTHPGERLRAGHILQPEVRIGGRVVWRGGERGCHQEREAEGEAAGKTMVVHERTWPAPVTMYL